jgi:hypothetical protein
VSGIGIIPDLSVGPQLYRLHRQSLIACEAVEFDRDKLGVETLLRRASISGRVEVGGELSDYFADVHDRDRNLLETVTLDPDSYRALKYRWMRCKVQSCR